MRTHGTVSCYQHDKSRCEDCRAAAAEARRRSPSRAPAEPAPRPDLSWFEDAACQNADPSDFFPDSPHDVPAAAQLLCMICPVFDACLTYGLTQRHGVWGGMSEAERDRIRKRKGIVLHEPDDDDTDDLEEIA